MKKNTKTVRVKQVKLTLGKETVAILTGDLLKQVAGKWLPRTDHSECGTFCLDVSRRTGASNAGRRVHKLRDTGGDGVALAHT